MSDQNVSLPTELKIKAPAPLFLMLWSSMAFPELVLHIATAGTPLAAFNSGLILGTGFSLAVALLLWGVICFIAVERFGKAVIYITGILGFFLCASQLVYYRIFGCFYSAYSMVNGAEAFQFWRTGLTQLLRGLPAILIMALPLAYYLIWGRRVLVFHFPHRRRAGVFPVAMAAAVQLVLVLTLSCWEGTGDISPYGLYHNKTDSYYSINKLGLFTAFRLDITRLSTGRESGGSIQLETDATLTSESTETEPVGAEPTIPNILNIDFDTLTDSTSDANLREVHSYFSSRTASNQNEKTGMFEGCNLVMITAEAFDYLIVDQARTPTLYKLMNEGFSFSNYYVPDWATSTTDGEYAFLTGTVPKSGVWSFYESADNSMPLTMSRQLISLGYSAYAYHGHTYDYYHRDEYLENLGYTYKAYQYGLDVTYTWPESDVEVVDLSTADFTSSEPFTAYYMTISGHREYNFYGNTIAYKNHELVENEPYSTAVQAYIACQLELENALTLLLERLEEAGVLDNTVIVLTADH